MSLRPEPVGEIPAETARVARAAFPKGTVVTRLRDEFDALYEDEDFRSLYPARGQPGLTPWPGSFKESLGWRGGWHRDGSRRGSDERPRAVQAAPAPSAGPCCATLPAPVGRSRSALGRRPRQASSRKLTSRRQCNWFSIAQCPRTSDSSASGPACSRVRLVTAYATSRLVWPLISRSRSMRPTWATPGQSRWGTTSRLVAMRRVSRRPCPFSTVQACSRSGGGPSQRASQGACSPRALISSGGKGVAECEGDVGHKLRLVRLHGEQVVPLAVAHALANRPLAERGVPGDDGSRQRAGP